jgi:FAD/FMN-containing dehydrogenase
MTRKNHRMLPFWEAMQPFVERSVSINHLGEEGDEQVRAAYGANYERLVELKNKYDPTNFFRLNHNIKPTA